jgi:hypothetical protein
MLRTARLCAAVGLFVVAIGTGTTVAGPSGGALPPVLVEIIEIAGSYGVPVDAEMVAVNVTAVSPAAPGWLKVYPCDEPEPNTSNVNFFAAGQVVPNLVFSRIADDGTICISTLAVVDIVVDINGYVPAGSTITPLPQPNRFLDTRQAAVNPIGAGQTIEVPIAGEHGVPADADLVIFNATAVAYDRPGFLQVFPCGIATAPSATSSLNYRPGTVVANTVISRLSATGQVCVFTLAPAHIIVDVSAYGAGGITTLPAPQRLIDTRQGGSRQPAEATLTLDITVRGDVPDDATAAVYNLTSTDATAPGFATSYPCNETQPIVSNLNFAQGVSVANAAVTKLSPTGQLCVYTLTSTHLIVDLIGYTQGQTEYIPLTPQRVIDTREGWQPTCGNLLLADANANWAVVRRASTTLEQVHLPPTASTRGVLLAPDCQSIIYLDLDGQLWRYPLTDRAPEPIAAERYFGQLVAVLDDGTIVGTNPLDTSTILVDVVAQEILFQFPTSGYLTHPQISRDGTVVAVEMPGEGNSQLATWDRATGTVLGLIEPLLGASPSLSPTGAYVLWQRFNDGNLITSVYGEEVDTMPNGFTRWVGPGTLLAQGVGGGRHLVPLFGSPDLSNRIYIPADNHFGFGPVANEVDYR